MDRLVDGSLLLYNARVAVVLALASALTFGAADFCGGLAAKRSHAVAVAGFSQLAGGLVLVLTLPLWGDPIAGTDDLLRGAAGGLCGAVALSSFYGALAGGKMSVVAPTTAVISAAVPVFAGLLFGERPATLALVGVGLALPAIGLVASAADAASTRPLGSTFLERPLVGSVFAGVGFGLFFVVLDGTDDASGVWPLVAARIVSVPLLLSYGVVRRRLFVARASVRLIAIAGVLDMAANVLYLLAVRRGLLSVVAVLAALYPVSTVVLARVVLHERLSRSQAVGISVAMLAVAAVALA